MNRVFVYGTLKKGHRNYDHYLQDATLVGVGQTVARCRMLDSGFPVLLRKSKWYDEVNAHVRGEVYECDEKTMVNLDRLESEGRMYHRRTKLIRLDDGRTIKAFVYIGDTRYWRGRRIWPRRGKLYNWPDRAEDMRDW